MKTNPTRFTSPRVIEGNRGDILSRWGIIATMREHLQANVSMFASKEEHCPKELRPVIPYGFLYNLIPRNLNGLKALLQARIVVWTGGLDIQDDSSLLKLCYLLTVFTVYRSIGLRIVCLSQGAGPVTTVAGRFLSRLVLSHVELFVSRDTGTSVLLRSISSDIRIVQGFDGIFLSGIENMPDLTDHDQLELQRIDSLKSAGPVIGINVRQWFHFSSSVLPFMLQRDEFIQRAKPQMTTFITAMCEFIRALKRNTACSIVLISMYEPNTDPLEDDVHLLDDILLHFSDDPTVTIVDADLSPQGVMHLFSRLNTMIGTRLHSTLAALRMGCPAVHISYTLKGQAIYQDMGLSDYVIAIEDFMKDSQSAVNLVLEILKDESRRFHVNAVMRDVVRRNTDITMQAIASLDTKER